MTVAAGTSQDVAAEDDGGNGLETVDDDSVSIRESPVFAAG